MLPIIQSAPPAAGASVVAVADEAADTTCFLAFFTAATGDLGPKTNSVLTFNASTGLVAFAGAGQLVIGHTAIDATFTPRLQLKSTSTDASNPVPLFLINRQNSNTPALAIGVDTSNNPTFGSNGGAGLLFGNHAAGDKTFTEWFRFDTNGMPIWKPGSATPATLTVNGQITMTLTSNTNLRFSARGSDGTTRVNNLTLA